MPGRWTRRLLNRRSHRRRADAVQRSLAASNSACAGPRRLGRPEVVFLDDRQPDWIRRRGAPLGPDHRRARRRRGVLLTTHFMEEAERLSDHVVIVDRGRAVASGTPSRADRDRRGSCGSARGRGWIPRTSSRHCPRAVPRRNRPQVTTLSRRRPPWTLACSPPSPPGAPSTACSPVADDRVAHTRRRLP